MKSIMVVVLIVITMLSMGCSGEGVFENPDSIEVTTLEAMHGSQGHQVKFHIGPNNRLGPKDAGVTKQVILKLHDPEITTATIYVVLETNSINLGGIVDMMKSATDVAIVPTLPEGTEPLTRMVLTFGGPGGDPYAGYLRIATPPAKPVFVSLRGTLTQERKAWYLRELRKPPEVIRITPAAVDSITYYRDPNLTRPFTGSVKIGETIYTKVVFSKAVPVTIADDGKARPQMLAFIGSKWFQYTMKPHSTNLQSRDAKPYRNTGHTFVCKYTAQAADAGNLFFGNVYVGDRSVSGDSLLIDDDGTPATITSITYYRDPNLTERLIDSVLAGETIYTKIVFSKAVPFITGDDISARPYILSLIGGKSLQYRVISRDANLQDGDTKPYQNTSHIFICKYVTQTEDVGSPFVTNVNFEYGPDGENPLQITFFVYTDPGTGNEPMLISQNPQDFLGTVLFPKPAVDVSPRAVAGPIADVTVTIMAGLRAGESTITNRHGQYLFSNVAGDTLHLRVERKHFEPKEVIVHRSRPTILAKGATPNFPQDPQKNPGTILIGQRWPDEIRFILEETLIMPDLLYVEGGLRPENSAFSGFYARGVIVVYSGTGALSLLAHEIAHAHQHALVSLDGSGNIDDWVNTPEGRAFAEAREKDWAAYGKVGYDTVPHFTSLLESAAETCAYWWSTGQWERPSYQKVVKSIPNRFKWAEEWLKRR